MKGTECQQHVKEDGKYIIREGYVEKHLQQYTVSHHCIHGILLHLLYIHFMFILLPRNCNRTVSQVSLQGIGINSLHFNWETLFVIFAIVPDFCAICFLRLTSFSYAACCSIMSMLSIYPLFTHYSLSCGYGLSA